ncbi:MAG: hypothetical protein VXW42_08235, partial [Planctomycetota bacterium]|nr:hypothetical protein [Planctomycetota bacterium]
WRSDKMMVEATMVGADTIGHPSSTVVGGEDKQEQAAWGWNCARRPDAFLCCRWGWLGEVEP